MSLSRLPAGARATVALLAVLSAALPSAAALEAVTAIAAVPV